MPKANAVFDADDSRLSGALGNRGQGAKSNKSGSTSVNHEALILHGEAIHRLATIRE